MKKLRTYLNGLDLAILTLILFVYPIYLSLPFNSYEEATTTSADVFETVTAADNYRMLFIQLSFIVIAFLYLKYRQFDFSQWQIHLSIKEIGLGIVFFIIIALFMDVFYFILDGFNFFVTPVSLGSTIEDNLSTVIYSFFNGFYEEIFFLGMCLAVPQSHKKWTFLASLLVRFSFHTYQGLITAIAISFIVGLPYYYLYEKRQHRNLLAFFITHGLADIFGLSLLQFFI